MVKEYDLDNKLLNDVVEKIYEGLMTKKRHKEAASFAKKYGL